MPAAAVYLAKRAAIGQSESQALHALGTPTQDSATFARMIAALRASGIAQTDALSAARANNPSGFTAAFLRGQSAGQQSGMLAKQFGLRVCGQ